MSFEKAIFQLHNTNNVSILEYVMICVSIVAKELSYSRFLDRYRPVVS